MRTVHIYLGQVQRLALGGLTGRHYASNYVGGIHVVGYALKVLAFPYLDVRIFAYTFHYIHVVPVPCKLSAVYGYEPLVAQYGVNWVLMRYRELVGLRGYVRVERELRLCPARGAYPVQRFSRPVVSTGLV